MRRGPLLLFFALSLVGLLAFLLLALANDPGSAGDPQVGWTAEIVLWGLAALLGGAFARALLLFRREVRREVVAMRSQRVRDSLRRNLVEFRRQQRLDRGRNS